MRSFHYTYLLLIAAVSAMGGLLFGYDWVVIGGAKPFYEQFFAIATHPVLQGWAMSSALVGCLIGALLSGVCSDRYGRKKMLILSAALFIVSSVGTGAATSFNAFIFYRIVGGIGIGIASNLSPMYIAEIAPAHLRGRLVSLNQLTIVIGILAAQIANWLIAEPVAPDTSAEALLLSWNGQWGWRWMFWAENVPALCFFLFAFLIPESPRWQLLHAHKEKALATLQRISNPTTAQQEYDRILSDSHRSTQKGNELKQLFSPSMRRVLTIGVLLAIFQQWCGINVIFIYAQEIFSAAGYGVSDILMNIVVTGLTNLVFTFVAIFTVDRLGRRTLLLIGSAGLTLIYALLGTAYFLHLTGILMVIIVVLAIACFAMSLAPVMWVVISEIFPNVTRGAAMSLATFALWSACFILTYTFPLLNESFGPAGTFWTYGIICLGGLLFIWRCVPETKNKSLEELENELIK